MISRCMPRSEEEQRLVWYRSRRYFQAILSMGDSGKKDLNARSGNSRDTHLCRDPPPRAPGIGEDEAPSNNGRAHAYSGQIQQERRRISTTHRCCGRTNTNTGRVDENKALKSYADHSDSKAHKKWMDIAPTMTNRADEPGAEAVKRLHHSQSWDYLASGLGAIRTPVAFGNTRAAEDGTAAEGKFGGGYGCRSEGTRIAVARFGRGAAGYIEKIREMPEVLPQLVYAG
ncbi:hypothetical protein C8R45DRAFT_946888 [Mycena sanguinolenta]|nr:hypothetical protein C8R45DRAFT_946888 [Mycena sanguinolenta]